MAPYKFDTEEALRLWEQGLTDPEIGDMLDVAGYCIRKWRNKNGLMLRNKAVCFDEDTAREMWRKGACDPEIAAAMCVTQQTIRYWRKRRGLKGNRPRRDGYRHDKAHDRPKADKGGYVDKLVDQSCHKCRFWCKNTNTCDYLIVTDKRRPCPPGKGCKVREKEIYTESGKRIRWDERQAWELYKQGLTDTQIAEAVGTTSHTIGNWRQRKNLVSNVVRREANYDWDREEARRLYDRGMIDKEIAKAVDVSPSIIWKWRQREGLDSNGRKK